MADYRIVLLVLFILLMDAEGKDVNLFYNENAAKIIKSPLRNPSQFGFSMTYQPALLLHQTFLTQKLVSLGSRFMGVEIRIVYRTLEAETAKQMRATNRKRNLTRAHARVQGPRQW
ncbi:hypothetical protein EVAR_60050_1 [Eumeta japonica]|uniref:Uncharacterized protein n=1 Tax=Eumeta variegata TaxID=151549 RepID=A0A4C1YXA9_EUMVA|nr:hypothetical protein EVAR_60050_1 [Eumeta japonica]